MTQLTSLEAAQDRVKSAVESLAATTSASDKHLELAHVAKHKYHVSNSGTEEAANAAVVKYEESLPAVKLAEEELEAATNNLELERINKAKADAEKLESAPTE